MLSRDSGYNRAPQASDSVLRAQWLSTVGQDNRLLWNALIRVREKSGRVILANLNLKQYFNLLRWPIQSHPARQSQTSSVPVGPPPALPVLGRGPCATSRAQSGFPPRERLRRSARAPCDQ